MFKIIDITLQLRRAYAVKKATTFKNNFDLVHVLISNSFYNKYDIHYCIIYYKTNIFKYLLNKYISSFDYLVYPK